MSGPNLEDASIQEIQLELISRAGYPGVVEDLVANPDLWEAALIIRMTGMQLIALRDLPENCWNADELFILAPNQTTANTLLELAENWCADSARILSGDEAVQRLGSTSAKDKRVVAVWWD